MRGSNVPNVRVKRLRANSRCLWHSPEAIRAWRALVGVGAADALAVAHVLVEDIPQTERGFEILIRDLDG